MYSEVFYKYSFDRANETRVFKILLVNKTWCQIALGEVHHELGVHRSEQEGFELWWILLNDGVNNVKLLRKWLGEELQAMDSAADRMWKRYVRNWMK